MNNMAFAVIPLLCAIPALSAAAAPAASVAPASRATSAAVGQRIISLGPAITEELYMLGVGKNIVGTTIYCNRPPQAKSKTRVGNVIDVSVEQIMALKPDLILATELTNARTVRKMATIGLRVEMFRQARNFNELCDQMTRLGILVGKWREAGKIVADARKNANAISQKYGAGMPSAPTRPKVFVQLGSKPLFAATRDSFVNDYVEAAGGVNITAGAPSGLVSRESIVAQNPDVIIIASMGIPEAEEKKVWSAYKSLSAVRNEKIFTVAADVLCSPTPPGFVATLEEIAKMLH